MQLESADPLAVDPAVGARGETQPQSQSRSQVDALEHYCYTVLLDGKVLGSVRKQMAQAMVEQLRFLKVSNVKEVPSTLEICFVPLLLSSESTETDTEHADPNSTIANTTLNTNSTQQSKEKKAAVILPGQYPGVYLYSNPARLMRPVNNLKHACVEWIGICEQVYLHIAVEAADLKTTASKDTSGVSTSEKGSGSHALQPYSQSSQSQYTHMEINTYMAMLSFLANLIPFPDFNQSPRNMYQIQMGVLPLSYQGW